MINDNQEKQLLKWIDLVEDIIKRMSNYSKQIKTWSVSLVVAVIALMRDNTAFESLEIKICLILSVLALWFLDSFYLAIERSYKDKYNDIVEYINGKPINEKIYNLKVNRNICKYLVSFFSVTEILFYGILVFGCILLFV